MQFGDFVHNRAHIRARYLAVTLIVLQLLPAPWLNAAFAQDSAEADVAESLADETAEAVAEPKPLSEDDFNALQEAFDTIAANREEIAVLITRVAAAEGLEQQVLTDRLDNLWLRTLGQVMSFGEKVIDLQDGGFDVTPFDAELLALFDRVPGSVRETIDRIRSQVILPDTTVAAMDQAVIDHRFFAAAAKIADAFEALLNGIELAEQIGLDATEEKDFLREQLADGTSNASVYLDIAKSQAAGLRSVAATMPDDKETAARLKLADLRVTGIAAAIQRNVSMMAKLDLPTAYYKQQLLSVTGEITTSVFEWDVIVGLLDSWRQIAVDFIVDEGPGFTLQLFVFFLIIFVFFKIGGVVQSAIRAGFRNSTTRFSVLLQDMVLSTSRNIVVILGVLIALSQVGISLGPLLTGLGIAGFIVGFALQDSLSNFASGMMILFYRPFDVGDTIEAAGARGQVSSMSLVNTTIRTFDNQSLIIPNNKIWQDVITNVTDQRERRIDMTFGITYDEDIDRVEKLLYELMAADERVLEDPAPMVKVGSFGDSSVDILCRPWVKTEDYWNVYWDLNKIVKQAFDREGITIPFPQRDVHVFNESAGPKPSDSAV